VVSPTPTGSVKLSPIDLNLTNRSLLEERLRSLAGPARRIQIAGRAILQDIPRPITLLLPDLAVRTTVISLDQLPPRTEEQEALIRWRLGQDQRLSMAGAKLFWQVFPPVQADESSYIVFVVAVQDSVLTQYESLCESAGLIPRRVGVSSFHLFNLWLKSMGGQKRLPRDLAWLTVSDGGLTCFIIHGGRPIFVRTKLLPVGDGTPGGGTREETVEKIVHESAASLLACQEYHPDVHVKHVVLATDDDVPGLDEVLGHELGVAVNRLEWDHVESLGWSHDGGNLSMAALPAVAGLV
jgi:hypothetical protein